MQNICSTSCEALLAIVSLISESITEENPENASEQMARNSWKRGQPWSETNVMSTVLPSFSLTF